MSDYREILDLARTILEDSANEPSTALYTLNVHEARTLANAVTRAANLADTLYQETDNTWTPNPEDYDLGWDSAQIRAADKIRTALGDETP